MFFQRIKKPVHGPILEWSLGELYCIFLERSSREEGKREEGGSQRNFKIIRMSLAMAEATARGLQINSPFQPPLITNEMWIEGCPWPQKSRHWKGVIMFEDEDFKSKNSESFVSIYNESLHASLMQQLFAPLSRIITHIIWNIPIRSSGLFRDVKSPELQPNLAPVFKDVILAAAEALPPSSINVPTHIKDVRRSTTLLAVPACTETDEIDSILEEHKDLKVDQGSKEILGFEPASLATSSTCLPNHNASCWVK